MCNNVKRNIAQPHIFNDALPNMVIGPGPMSASDKPVSSRRSRRMLKEGVELIIE